MHVARVSDWSAVSLYGLAAGGQGGAELAIAMLAKELERALTLLGRQGISL